MDKSANTVENRPAETAGGGDELKTDWRSLNALAADIHFHNQKAGWWDDGAGKYVIATKIALIHSEVSEMLEGFRKGEPDKHLPHRSNAEVELADAIIRLLDLAGSQGFDVEAVIAEKREYNAQRIDHSRAHRGAGGKAY